MTVVHLYWPRWRWRTLRTNKRLNTIYSKRTAFNVCTSQAHRQCQFTIQLVDSIYCQVSSILSVVYLYIYFISAHLWFQFHHKNVATKLALKVSAVVRSNSECRFPSRVCGCYSRASCSSVCCTGWYVTDVSCALDSFLNTLVGMVRKWLKEIDIVAVSPCLFQILYNFNFEKLIY